MADLPEKPCPKARRHSGRKAKLRVPHPPHDWWAGRYLPIGDVGYQAHCPGYTEDTPTPTVDVLYATTLDGGAYRMRVERRGDHTGELIVERGDGTELYRAEVRLSYGARFGADLDDVAAWQNATLWVVEGDVHG